MKIGLVDVDGHNYPNLMKLSTYRLIVEKLKEKSIEEYIENESNI